MYIFASAIRDFLLLVPCINTQCVWYGQYMAWSSLQMQKHTSGSAVLPHAIAATEMLLSYTVVGLMWSWLWNNTDK